MSTHKIVYNNRTGCYNICDLTDKSSKTTKLYQLWFCDFCSGGPFLKKNELYKHYYTPDGIDYTLYTDGEYWYEYDIFTGKNFKFKVTEYCSNDENNIKTIIKYV